MSDTDEWHIEIELRNAEHQVLETMTLNGTFAYTDSVDAAVRAQLTKRLSELHWCGFGLWAEHVPIKAETTFGHINFLRQASKRIVLQCEDHACQWRSMKVTNSTYDECVVCLEATPSDCMPMCGHKCLCETCFANVQSCPICRFPFLKVKIQV